LIPAGARLWLGALTGLICVFSVAPVAVIVIESFTETDYIVFPPQGFGFKWYAEFLKRPEFVDSAIVSLVVAFAAGLLATAMGTAVALALVRHPFPGAAWLRTLFMAPLSLPGLIFGLALLQFLARFALPRDLGALILAHTIITMPFAIRFVSVALLGQDRNLELAAASLGADRWASFRYVTLPLVRPGVVASLVFTFIVSFDEVAASLFLSGARSMTLPVRIYVYIDQNYDPLVTAVSSILVGAAVLAIGVIERTVGVGRLFGLR
jgi:putative spermidine/putrescine transport system permease protein